MKRCGYALVGEEKIDNNHYVQHFQSDTSLEVGDYPRGNTVEEIAREWEEFCNAGG